MIKKIATIFIAVVMIIVGFAILAHGQEMVVEITTESEKISVVENITIDTEPSDIFNIWIQDGHSDITFISQGTVITAAQVSNVYSINLTEEGLTSASYIEVQYSLDKDTSEFSKVLQYNTTSKSITYDETEIYTGSNLKSGSSLNVALQKAIPGQTIPVETIPTWCYLIIIILVIILIISLLRPSKKQKPAKISEATGGSEELLSTKKTLLMEILKEIEKQHRAKQISDDTYHKLKERYKQEAVEAMKQLDDIKSKS